MPRVGQARNACRTARLNWIRERKPWAQPRPARYKQFAKARKVRSERRRAKLDPECEPTYGRYFGWDD